MDFDFTDDQEQLRDAVARWVEKGFGFERRHAHRQGRRRHRDVYNELAELGLTGLAVPEAHGGMGFGAVEAMVVMEELGRGLVNAPYAHGALVAPALLAPRPRPCRPPGCRRSPTPRRWWCWRTRSATARYR
jgi:alkylation response protein AidB-like acyl-CoA dehydrogenase